jgi:hypothetical protein
MTEAQWAVVVETINERWPDRPRGAAWAAAWWPTAAGLEVGVALAALEVYAREANGFPPDAGQLARLAADVTDPDGWDGAWGEVQRQVRLVGYLGTPSFDDPALAAAVESFGWRSLCWVEEENIGTARAQLRDIYRAARQRSRRGAALESLPPGPTRDAIAATVNGLRSDLSIGDGR